MIATEAQRILQSIDAGRCVERGSGFYLYATDGAIPDLISGVGVASLGIAPGLAQAIAAQRASSCTPPICSFTAAGEVASS